VFRSSWLLLLPLFVFIAGPAGAASPAVARPGTASAGASAAEARGLVFFLAVDGAPGVAAVGTAHTIPLEQVAAAGKVDFFLGGTLTHVASSTGFLVPPGRPFSLPDSTIRGDFVVYALDAPPKGTRALKAATQLPEVGRRVKLLGVPSKPGRNEDDIFGTVEHASPARLEIALDLTQSLAGWGGAPVIDAKTRRVLGLLQAVVPGDSTTRVIAAPIGGVLEALAEPLPAGDARAFTAHAEPDEAALLQAQAARPASANGTGGKLLARDHEAPTRVHLQIEYPPAGDTVGKSACGVFVSGRALAMHGDMRRFDVVMAIDTSRSTVDPTGTDINANGKVGERRLGRLGAIFGSGSTDPGDSILAAEVAAARQLLHGLDPRSTRVGLVVFSGDPGGGGYTRGNARPAFTLEPLTRDYTRIERSLDYLVATEPEGSTHMAAGVDQATIELLGLRGAVSTPDAESEKVVFFFTDGQPTLPYGPDAEADNVRAVLRAANRAQRGRIRIHSFAIGPEALDGPIATVEMASRTDGFFTPVRHPGDLVDVVDEVSFANIQEIALWSVTSGDPAHPFRTTADGTFSGLISMAPGINRVQVSAVADDGTKVQSAIEINFVPDAPTAPLPREFVVRRNRLLEDCLREAKRLRLQAEREHAEQVRRDLKVEIERERAKARQRAAEQRKRLQLDMDDDEG
jgi:hypothetical protein